MRALLFRLLVIHAAASQVGCLGSSDGAFSDLVSGSIEDVDDLTFDQIYPDVTSVIVEQNKTQNFFVSARAPTGRVISYAWTLNSTAVSATAGITIVGSPSNVGNHTLKLVVSDGTTTKSKSWAVKVNGPPTASAVTTGTPKVAVGSTTSITASASDPNGDTLTYTWTLNGVSSPHLVGSGASAVLTGNDAIVGTSNIGLSVSDGTASVSVAWTAEVNHFPNACNTLATGQVCTVSGSPSVGNGINPLNSDLDLKIRPISFAQDSLGNFFIADYGSNIIWYWNRTASAVSRLGVSVPANTIKVVGGTGEAANGADGVALQSAINGPRGLYYLNSASKLYISEWGSGRVRYIDSNGFIYTGMGGSTSHTNGAAAYTHRCRNAAGLAYYSGSLYVACRNEHRVKRWDLASDLAYVIYGTGGDNFNNMGSDATAAGSGRPYGLWVDSDGIYTASYEYHRVTFVNHSASTKTFWASSTALSVDPNKVKVIIGNGTNGQDNNITPQSGKVGQPTGVVVSGTNIFVSRITGSKDAILLANNSGAAVSLGGVSVPAGKLKQITSTSNAGYNGSGFSSGTMLVNEPYHIGLSLDGNTLYFADYNNFRLRQISLTSGILSDTVGSGKFRNGFYGDVSKPTGQHLFTYIAGVVFDSTTRDLFFSDANNCRVRKTDKYGRTETVISRGCGDPTVDNDVPSNSYLRLNWNINSTWMAGLDLIGDDSLVIANSNSHNTRVFNRTNTDNTYYNIYLQNDRVSNLAGDYTTSGNGANGAALSTSMLQPTSIKYNPTDGLLYIADSGNHCIRKLDTAGNTTIVAGTCGTSGNSTGVVAAASVLLNGPTDIDFDPDGNMIFSDRMNHKVRMWNRTASPLTLGAVTIGAGQIGTIACANGNSGSATEGIFGSSASCDRPTGVAVNSAYICYADTYRHNVRCINRSGANKGKVTTVAGYPTASARAGSPYGFEQEGVSGTAATLYYPSALAFDSAGNLYIADTYNHIVRKVRLY